MIIHCAAVVLVGFSTPPTKDEVKAINAAKMGCMRTYKMEAPCLKTLTETGKNTYKALCTKGKK